MRKQIILILSFLMMAVCLTGCSTKITREKIDEITKIAEKIKENPTSYKLPDGYSVDVEDCKGLGRIIIKAEASQFLEEDVKVTFDITKQKVELIDIEESYNYTILYNSVGFFLVGFILAALIFIPTDARKH